jgi:hypothetical protein
MPLLSGSATGTVGKTLTFGNRKGANTVRMWGKPANPMTQGQQDSRNIVRVMGAAQKFTNQCVTMGAGRDVTDKDALKAAAPAGQTWNGYLVFEGTGAGAINYTDAEASYTTLAAAAAWDAAAAAQIPAISAVAQYDVGGVAGTPKAAGLVYFHQQYALYKAGIAVAPTATPPTYA